MENQTNRRARAKKTNTLAEEKKVEEAVVPFYDKEMDPMPKEEGKKVSEHKADSSPMFTLDQVQKMIEEAVSKKLAESASVKNTSNTQSEETVTLRFQAEVNDNNVIQLGANSKFGQITGKKATIVIPKRDFFGEFRTALVQALLRDRTLLVIDGLTDEERERHGVLYRKGEFLEEGFYEKLTSMGDEVVDVYKSLHPTWRRMVATRCLEAYDQGKLAISRAALVKMNRISKDEFSNLEPTDVRRKGAFWTILERMRIEEDE